MADDDWGDPRMSSVDPPPRRRRSNIQPSEAKVEAMRSSIRGWSKHHPHGDDRYQTHARQVLARQKEEQAKQEHEDEEELAHLQSDEELKRQMLEYKKAEAGVKMTRPPRKKPKFTTTGSQPQPEPRRNIYSPLNPLTEQGTWGEDDKPASRTARKTSSKPVVKPKTQGKAKRPITTQSSTTASAGGRTRDSKGRFVSAKPKGKKQTKQLTGKVVGVVAGGKGARGVKTGPKVRVTSEFKGREAADVVKTSKALERQRAQEVVQSKVKLEAQRKEQADARASAKAKRTGQPRPKPTAPRDSKGRFIAPGGKKPKSVLSRSKLEEDQLLDVQAERLRKGEITKSTYDRYAREKRRTYVAPPQSVFLHYIRVEGTAESEFTQMGNAYDPREYAGAHVYQAGDMVYYDVTITSDEAKLPRKEMRRLIIQRMRMAKRGDSASRVTLDKDFRFWVISTRNKGDMVRVR